MKYIIPQELKSETKLWKWIYLSDLIFIISYVAITNILNIFVPSQLSTVYLIFNIIVALSLSIRSPFNPKKRIYHSIIYLLFREKGIYKPIPQEKKKRNIL